MIQLIQLLEEVKDLLLLQTKDVLTLKEFCQYTGFSKVYAYRLLSKRAIPFSKPTGGNVFILKSDVIKFLASNPIKDNATLQKKTANYLFTSKSKSHEC